MQRLLALCFALVAVPALAADFSINLQDYGYLPSRIAVGELFTYRVGWSIAGGQIPPAGTRLEVTVPGVVTQLFHTEGMSCTTASTIHCSFSDLQPFGSLLITIRVDTPGRYTTTARAIQNTPDTNPANDVATHEFDAVAVPSVELFQNGLVPPRLDPGQRGTLSLTAINRAATPATNVVLKIELPNGGTFESASDPTCTVSETSVTCPRASLAQEQSLTIEVGYVAPQRTSGEDLLLTANVTSAEEDIDPTDNEYRRFIMMPRQFVVENVEDQGSGTLRQAILDLNTLCTFNEPCEIAFRIPGPVPASGRFTIQPRTPLPELAGNAIVDGATQTAFTGDTNTTGPEIEINGALVVEQSGLRVRPECSTTVRNLAVSGFPGYGIEVRRPFLGHGTEPCVLDSQVRLRAEISQNHLSGNQRGLGIFTLVSNIHDNVISGNRRAGIYMTDTFYAEVRRNTIDHNGAGMFFDTGDPVFGFPGGVDVYDNVIASNEGMAIARTRRGKIEIVNNSMYDNLLQGIDIDLDGPTANRASDAEMIPNRPVLTSARYDPVQNASIIRGRLDSEVYTILTSYVIEVFASAGLSKWGYPQAETRLRRAISAAAGSPPRTQCCTS